MHILHIPCLLHLDSDPPPNEAIIETASSIGVLSGSMPGEEYTYYHARCSDVDFDTHVMKRGKKRETGRNNCIIFIVLSAKIQQKHKEGVPGCG